VESTCIRARGLVGTQDWDLMPIIVTGDFTFVTLNAGYFRGKGEDEPGGLFGLRRFTLAWSACSQGFP